MSPSKLSLLKASGNKDPKIKFAATTNKKLSKKKMSHKKSMSMDQFESTIGVNNI